MNGLGLGFVLVALKTLGGVRVLVQRDGMNRGGGARRQQHRQANASQDVGSKPAATVVDDRFAEPDAMREQFHTVSDGGMLHEGRRNAKRRLRVAARP